MKISASQVIVRECTGEDLIELQNFLSTWLRRSEENVIGKEYPLLFKESPLVKHFIVKDGDGEMASHAAVIIRYIVSGRARLRFGMISNVFTRPDARGMGLATRVVSRAIEFLEESRCALAILWSDKEKFYSKLHFKRMGKEWIFTLYPAGFHENPHGLREYDESLAKDILALHERKPLRVERSLEEMIKLLRIPKMKTYVYIGPSGKTEAYACLGKGEDFNGWIHETGGDPVAVETLLGGIIKKLGKPAYLVLSPQEEKLGRSLMEKGFPCREGALGLCRVLNEEAIRIFAYHLGPLAMRYKGKEPFLPFHLGGLDSV